MNKLIFILIIYLSLISNLVVNGQEDMRDLDGIYGLNSELYNGRIYSDFYSSHVKGHPFLINSEYLRGTIEINNKFYNELLINYDVFTQKVLLSFTNHARVRQLIEIPLINIESFSFSNKKFQVITMPDSTLKIFQVIGKDENLILLHWIKRMNTTGSESTFDYKFTSPEKNIWILMNHQLYPLRKNKSLLNLFEKDQALVLKKWLNRQHIRIQKANDQQLKYVSEYLNAL